MTFGLAPTKNVTTLFENWLKVIFKKDFKIEWVFALLFGPYEIIKNDFIFNKLKNNLFCRLFL
jgi:hypothetical protein